MMHYKGYLGSVEFDPKAAILRGEVVGIRDVITFEGRSETEVEQAFRESVDDYLSFCDTRSERPDFPRDAALESLLVNAKARFRRLSAQEHMDRENNWRAIFGRCFREGVRHRTGAKAVHDYLNEKAERWVLVPFLANVPGTPVSVRAQTLGAFECEGPLLEFGQFSDVEFFISPTDFAWTFVSTHEDFALGGPYFVRAAWIEDKVL